MEIELGRDTLARCLSLAAEAVGTAQILPIVSNVLVRAEGDGVHITATDLESGITISAPAVVKRAGTATAPAAKLKELVKAFTGDRVRLSLSPNGGSLGVMDAVTRASLVTLPPGEFPDVWAIPPGVAASPTRLLVDVTDLARGIEQTQYAAASKDDSRPMFAGLNLRVDPAEGRLRFAATDGSRLAVAIIPAALRGALGTSEVTIPVRALEPLVDAIKGVEGSATLEMTELRLSVTLPSIRYYSQCIVANLYPDVARVIPPRGLPGRIAVTVPREALIEAVKRIGIVDDVIVLRSEPGHLRLSAAAADLGSAHEAIAATVEGVREDDLMLRGRFFTDALSTFADARVLLTYGDSGASLRVSSAEADEAVAVIMPIRHNVAAPAAESSDAEN